MTRRRDLDRLLAVATLIADRDLAEAAKSEGVRRSIDADRQALLDRAATLATDLWDPALMAAMAQARPKLFQQVSALNGDLARATAAAQTSRRVAGRSVARQSVLKDLLAAAPRKGKS